MRLRGIWLAGCWPGDASFPRLSTISKRLFATGPTFAPYLYDYALTLSSGSQFDRAQESAAAAARADPKLAEAHALLGGLLARKRRLPEAAREYQEAVRLRPDFARARLDLASVLVAQGDLPGAEQQLREAAKSTN